MRLKDRSVMPKIAFGEGDDRFELVLRHITGTDRVRMMDAARLGDAMALYRACLDVVTDWFGVTDAAGNLVPFREQDRTGAWVCRLDDLLGSVSSERQEEVIGGILSFCGVVSKQAAAHDPTPPPAGSTDGGNSNS